MTNLILRWRALALLLPVFGLPVSSTLWGDAHAIAFCETWLTITQAPPASTTLATVAVTVEFGETVTSNPSCISMGPPDPSTFQFTVNNSDVTSHFSVGEGVATASAVPLVVGNNALEASVLGHASSGDQYTQTAQAAVERHASSATASITPVSAADTLELNRPDSIRFVVRNTGTDTTMFALACASATNLTCLGVTPTSVYLAPNATAIARTRVRADAVGQVQVGLTATSTVVSAGSTPTPVVQRTILAPAVPFHGRVDRTLCPTTTVAPDAAVQCGDLLYAHGLPGYRSLGRERAITLLYNSATVAGRSMVAVDYRHYPSRGAAQGLRLDVKRPGSPTRIVGRAYYSVNATSTDLSNARLALPVLWDSLAPSPGASATGSYPLTLTVVRKMGGVWREDLAESVNMRLNVVDRRTSPWGAGWWMAGLERGYEDPNGMLIAFGDGSSTYFPGPGLGLAPAGERSELEWHHLYGSTRVLQGRRLQVRYGFGGLPTAVVDTNPVRNFATYHWSGGSRLDSIVDPVGRVTRFVHDGAGRVVSILGPRGDTTVLTQTIKAGATYADLDAIVDPDGYATPFTYQGANRLMATSQARATGLVSYAFHAPSGTLDTVSAPAGVSASGRRLRASLRVGAATEPFAAIEASALPLVSTDDATAVVSWWRLVGGQQVRDTAWFRVHSTGAPTAIKTPESGILSILRDSIGQPTRVRTPGGAEYVQDWDADGNLRATWARLRQRWTDTTTRADTVRYEYHPVWKSVTRTISATHDTTLVTYDNYGRVSTVTDPLGRPTRFTYWSRGMLASVIAPHPTQVGQEEPFPTTYAYDSTGTSATWNLLRVLRDGQGPAYEYDATGLRPRVAVDATGNRTEYALDAVGRPTTISRVPQVWSSGDNSFQGLQAPQRDVSFLYDDVARTRTMSGPRGLFMVDSLDALGRVTRHCLGYNWCEKIAYEDGLNPTRHERRRGDIIEQTFDGAGRITSRTSRRSATSPVEDLITYGYDVDGNRTRVDNRYSRLRWRYDAWGRPRSEEQAIRWYRAQDSTRFTGVTFFHDYDANGRRARTYAAEAPGDPLRCSWCLAEERTDSVLANPIGYLTYEYHRDGSLWRMANDYWASGTTGWVLSYDRKNRPTQLVMPTTMANRNYTYSHDALDRLVAHRFQVPGGGTETDSLMLFDADGRVLHMRHNNAETRYVFDGLGQLRYNSGGRISADSMRYDANGNLQRSGVWTYEYDIDYNGNRGQLLYRKNLFCRIDHEHDLNGNLTRTHWQSIGDCENQPTSAGERVHGSSYDAEGRMVLDTSRFRTMDPYGNPVDSVEVREYWYDGLGRRILQHSKHNRVGEEGFWRYFWADNHVAVKIANPKPGTYTSAPDELWPAITANGPMAGEWFVYGPGMDQVLGRLQKSGQGGFDYQLFYHDYRGSVVRLTDQTGADKFKTATRYESFGQPVSAPTGAEALPGYNGLEAPGGLVYMRNRWYDPASGRFTQEDPIGFAGGSNLYAYAGNDPVNYADPFGLSPEQQGDSTVEVGCRRLEGAAGAVGNHCAIRVTVGDSSRVGELLNDGGKNKIVWWGPGNASVANAYNWTRVNASAGAVTATFNRLGAALAGREYSAAGNVNSNRFVFDVITGAGGRVPSAVVPTHGATPGICGGSPSVMLGGWVGGAATGNQCSP